MRAQLRSYIFKSVASGVKMKELATHARKHPLIGSSVHEPEVCIPRFGICPQFETIATRFRGTVPHRTHLATSVNDTVFTLLFTVAVIVYVPGEGGKV
jgi:hypothetical protein